MSLQFVLALLFLLLAFPAAQENPIQLSALAGFDGIYEESAPVPVFVSVRNDGAAVEGEIQVVAPAGVGEELIYSAPVSLPAGADKRVPLVVQLPPFAGEVTVRLAGEEGVLAENGSNRLSVIGRDQLLYGVVSPDLGALTFLETAPGRRSDAAVAFLGLADLPEVSSAWNALDVLVLHDVDTSRLTVRQKEAMRAWVESGGQLVVTGGPGGPQTAAGVADLLPVTVTGVTTVDALPALTEYGGSPPEAPGPYVLTTADDVLPGEVLIREGEHTLLAERSLGRGRVTFLALDPKLAPLAGWDGSMWLWEHLAAGVPDTPPWGSGMRDGYAAAQAASVIPGLRLPSAGQLLLFLLLYTAVIGPINFIILRRINRRELAWGTIPVLVLLFSAATFLTGFSTRGNRAALNVMSVAFGSADAERLRTQSVLGLYSPRRGERDITFPYDASVFPLQEGFGTLVPGGNVTAIERAGDVTIRGARADTGEIATFIADAHLPRPAVRARATLDEAGNVVDVTVRNDTDGTLEDAVILYGQEQVGLGDLSPGAEKEIQITPSAPTPAPALDPLFPAASIITNPLLNDPSLILGTPDFFSDPEAYPRWQLLQAHYSDNPAPAPDPAKLVTLAGWLPGALQEAAVSGEASAPTGVTLLLLEVPVE